MCCGYFGLPRFRLRSTSGVRLPSDGCRATVAERSRGTGIYQNNHFSFHFQNEKCTFAFSFFKLILNTKICQIQLPHSE